MEQEKDQLWQGNVLTTEHIDALVKIKELEATVSLLQKQLKDAKKRIRELLVKPRKQAAKYWQEEQDYLPYEEDDRDR